MGVPFGLLLRIALRSLLGHRIKGLIVSVILAFGAFLVVLGTTLLDNVERTMEASITGSLTGHIQLISENAKDDLAFFGPDASSQQDLSVIPSFATVKAEVQKLPGVKAVIPMGRQIAQAVVGNEFDEVVSALRDAIRREDHRTIEDSTARVKRLVGLLTAETENTLQISAHPEEQEEALAILRRAGSDTFWTEFAEDPVAALEFLDTKVAPLTSSEAGLFLPYVATDLDAYAANFPHFRIAEGEMVPKGRKGFLFNKRYFEDLAKNKVARQLDKIRDAIVLDGKTIATDPLLKENVDRTAKSVRYVTQQLGPKDAVVVEELLRKELPGVEGDLDALVTAFLQVDDENFQRRYDLFYESIAPKIRLYRIKVGDTITIRAISHSGYMRAINVKVWGTFVLDGLERSELASIYSLLDLMSFRDLYGLMTPEKREEIDALRSDLGLRELDRDSVEDDLFGGDDGPAVTDLAASDGPAFDVDHALAGVADGTGSDSFDPAAIDDGVVLHAAVILDDPTRLFGAMEEIENLSRAKGLGIQAHSWQKVAGIIGQFILVMRVILYVAIAIIFAVALVIINNSMVMATMDRVAEIGTMRAIGAQRRFVLALFLVETVVLGLLAGGAGALAATGFLSFLHGSGIPAGNNDFLIFLFGGPALHPEIGLTNFVGALLAILLISLVSTLYPARIAARIAPVVAMQARE